MNETLPTGETENDEKAPGSGAGLAFLATVLALASLAGSGWLWWQSFGEGDQATEQLTQQAAGQRRALEEMGSRVSQLESRVAALPTTDPARELAGLEQALNALQAEAADSRAFQQETAAWTHSMQAAIEGNQARLAALTNRNMDASAELDLAEISYVLRLAQERLQLFGDTRTATEALKIADQQIAAFDHPIYLGIRREIATAVQQLAQVQEPDYPTVFRAIDSLQVVLTTLPFKGAGDAREEVSENEETGWWARLRNAFSGLVTVRRSTGSDDVLPVLADQALVTQQAWIGLELARLSAMRRDQVSYDAALDRFAATLNKWFDPDSAGMRQAGALLKELEAVNVNPAVPDISSPWIALQAIRASGVAVPARSDEGMKAEEGPPEGPGEPGKAPPAGQDEIQPAAPADDGTAGNSGR